MKCEKIISGVLFFFLLFYISAGNAAPDFFTFTLKDRILTGEHFSSGTVPVMETQLEGDTLVIEIDTELVRRDRRVPPLRVELPPQTEKIRLFDCDFVLPPPGRAAYIRVFPLVEIRKAWYEIGRSEYQWALLMICFDEKKSVFSARINYLGKSGRDIWTWHWDYECKILPDNRIVSNKTTTPFFIKDGKLYIELSTTGKYYKYCKSITVKTDFPASFQN